MNGRGVWPTPLRPTPSPSPKGRGEQEGGGKRLQKNSVTYYYSKNRASFQICNLSF